MSWVSERETKNALLTILFLLEKGIILNITMPRFLCIGDLHIQNSNIPDVDQFLVKLELYLKECTDEGGGGQPLDFIVVLGDTLHTHEKIHTVCLNKALEYFQLLRKYTTKLFILIGNHDYINCSQFLSTNHPFIACKEWEGVEVVDTVRSHEVAGGRFVFSPFVPDGRFVEGLNTVSDNLPFRWQFADCIFGHQTLNGAKMGAITATQVEEWKSDYPMLITGHIHDKQTPQLNLHYTGSAMQHAYGESCDKTIALCSLTPSEKGARVNEGGEGGVRVRVTDINLHLKKKKIVYLTIPEFEKLEMKRNDEVHIKLIITGEESRLNALKKTRKYVLISKTHKVSLKSTPNKHFYENVVNPRSFSFLDTLESSISTTATTEGNTGLVELYKKISGRDLVHSTVENEPLIEFED